MLPEHIYHRQTNPQPIHCHTIKYMNKQYQQLQLRLHVPASPNASNSEQGFIPQPRGDKMRGKLSSQAAEGKESKGTSNRPAQQQLHTIILPTLHHQVLDQDNQLYI